MADTSPAMRVRMPMLSARCRVSPVPDHVVILRSWWQDRLWRLRIGRLLEGRLYHPSRALLHRIDVVEISLVWPHTDHVPAWTFTYDEE